MSDQLDAEPTAIPTLRSRRAVIAGALGGVAGLLAGRLGRPDPVAAAAGSSLIIGSQANDAGTSDTQLLTNSNVVAFKLLQRGPGTSLMGYTDATAGATRGVYGRVDSPNGDGVQARNGGAAGTGAAVRAFGGANSAIIATTDSGAFAVMATNNSGSGQPRGVYASGAYAGVYGSGSTYGVVGIAVTGVYGESSGGTGVHGYSSTGKGVLGFAGETGTNAVAYGVHGYSASAQGTGIFGQATSGSGTTFGVRGESSSSTGFGVYGSSVHGNGVRGASASNDGVVGTSGSLAGVAGSSSSGNGVYGESSFGYAGYFAGNTHVAGTLSKAAGSFVIDHPLDPARKTLSHSFVESPDMLNIYNGTVTTDATGEATVSLPAWFGALNKDVRYQLTTIGSFARATISAKVKNNRFSIKTEEPNIEVSWQVTGIRQDAYANEHRIPVESDKPKAERGTYLHPIEHGKPASAGRDYPIRQRHLKQAPPAPTAPPAG
jgi:hypothetical protein